jgi:hypothetical protein
VAALEDFMKRLLLLSTCLFFAPTAFAQQAGMQSPAYRECSVLANSNPAQALSKADSWLRMDTGIAPLHCRAMALYGLRRFAEAGDLLTTIRDMITPENIALRSYVARQASNAWIGANRADDALAILGKQIAEISAMRTENATAALVTADLLVERARINTGYGKLDIAVKDLDHAVSLTPTNENVLMERAGVFEKIGDIPLAMNDLKSVLAINGGHNAARAALSRLSGGAPMPSTAHRAAGTAPFMAAQGYEAEEKPVYRRPVKQTKKKKRVKKSTPVETSSDMTPASAAAIPAMPKPVVAEKPVAVQKLLEPAKPNLPVEAVKPVVTTQPVVAPAPVTTPTAAAAPKPLPDMPALPALPTTTPSSSGSLPLPPLPKP